MQYFKYSPSTKCSQILFESQHFFSVLFNESPDAIFILDGKDYSILECNEKALELFETKTKSSLINLSAFRLFDNEPIEFSKNIHESKIKNLSDATQELTFRTFRQNVFCGRLNKHFIQVEKQQFLLLRISKAIDYLNTEEELSTLLRGTSKVTGFIFFKELSRLLCKTFHVKYSFVAKISGDKKSLQVLESNGPFKNLKLDTYTIEGSLVENVINGYTTFYPKEVKKLFGSDELVKQNNINGFMGTPVFGGSGEVIGMIAFLDDIPIKEVPNSRYILSIFASRTAAEMQRIRSKEILKEQARKLATSDNIKDKLLSIISQDLKIPFLSVLEFSELLKSNIINYDKKNISDRLEVIDNGVREIYFLLENLSDWSRIFRGDIRQTPQRVSLNEVVEKNLTSFNYLINAKNIKILVKLNKCPDVNADLGMVSSIVRNIVSNAIKYSSNGSEIKIEYSVSAKLVNLFVHNSGVGMSDEQILKIMQADDEMPEINSSNNSSAGLGLSLAKNFIRRIGGKLQIESAANKGTSVDIFLPIA